MNKGYSCESANISFKGGGPGKGPKAIIDRLTEFNQHIMRSGLQHYSFE